MVVSIVIVPVLVIATIIWNGNSNRKCTFTSISNRDPIFFEIAMATEVLTVIVTVIVRLCSS